MPRKTRYRFLEHCKALQPVEEWNPRMIETSLTFRRSDAKTLTHPRVRRHWKWLTDLTNYAQHHPNWTLKDRPTHFFLKAARRVRDGSLP